MASALVDRSEDENRIKIMLILAIIFLSTATGFINIFVGLLMITIHVSRYDDFRNKIAKEKLN